MKILYGKPVADSIYLEFGKEVIRLKENKITPHLAIIMVGDDPVSLKYIETKSKAMEKIGLEISLYRLAEDSTQKELGDSIQYLNDDNEINGILVQLPLPKHLDVNIVKSLISLGKDVDGFLMQKYKAPAPQAIIDMLDFYEIQIKGQSVLLVGFGTLVGQPVSQLLKDREAKVSTSTNSSHDLIEKMKTAKIVISAVGKPKLINKDIVNKDQVIIDAGTASEGNATIGDVDFAEVFKIVEAVSPVPGGIGPVTVAELFRNVVWATLEQNNL